MAHWQEFAAEAPDLCERGRRRLESTGLCLVGTLRRDGSPRISPVEPLIIEGDLKLYGRATPVADAGERQRYCRALESLTGWAPDGDQWHLFRLDIDQAAWFQVVPPDGHHVEVWRPGTEPEARERP